MHRIEHARRNDGAAGIGLVGHDDQRISAVLEPADIAHGRIVESERLDRLRGRVLPVAEFGDDEDPVTIEKTGGMSARFSYRTYHLVVRRCKTGWLTRQCQTTA
jgi:hypothetical protein